MNSIVHLFLIIYAKNGVINLFPSGHTVNLPPLYPTEESIYRMWEWSPGSPWVFFNLKEKCNHFSQTLVFQIFSVINHIWYNLITGQCAANSMSSRHIQVTNRWRLVRKWFWRSSLTRLSHMQFLNHNFWNLYHIL